MRSFWKRGPRPLDLETELRRNRPEPRPEFVAALSDHVREDARRSRAGALRVAFAGALTLVMLVALASVGGIGYAATAASNAAKSVAKITKVHKPTVARHTAAADQYAPQRQVVCVKVAGKFRTKTIPKSQVKNQVNQRGEHTGRCTGRESGAKPGARGGKKGKQKGVVAGKPSFTG